MSQDFQIDLSELMKRRLFKLQHEAKALGIPKKYLSSLKQIVSELSSHADTVGIPLDSQTSHSNIMMRYVRLSPLEMEFGVHVQKRVVWIKDVRLISVDIKTMLFRTFQAIPECWHSCMRECPKREPFRSLCDFCVANRLPRD